MTKTAKAAARPIRRRPSGADAALPSFILTTDPRRGGDPLSAAARLAAGDAVLLRHYREPKRMTLQDRLALLCRRRRLRLIVALDADRPLPPPFPAPRRGGAHIGAPGGVPSQCALMRLRRRCPDVIIVAAAHDPGEVRRRAPFADALIVSPVFATQSHPEARPLGLGRFAATARAAGRPIYAMGGVALRRIAGLPQPHLVGVAAVAARRQ